MPPKLLNSLQFRMLDLLVREGPRPLGALHARLIEELEVEGAELLAAVQVLYDLSLVDVRRTEAEGEYLDFLRPEDWRDTYRRFPVRAGGADPYHCAASHLGLAEHRREAYADQSRAAGRRPELPFPE